MNNNKLLLYGVILIITGVCLFIYSAVSYSEVKSLYDKINFDELDNNNLMPVSDKYYKHLSIADFLNLNLEKNKSLPFKNTSCVYLDYARHNTISLYKLIYNGDRNEIERRHSVEKNVENLLNMLDYYKICKQAPSYKIELQTVLDDIKKSNEIFNNSDFTLNSFLYSKNQNDENKESLPDNEQEINPNNALQPVDESIDSKGEIILQHSYSGETDSNQ